MSEERRKRLQELEKELASSKRRMAEIQKLEKENIRLQEQSKKLSTELNVCLLINEIIKIGWRNPV